MSPQEIMSRRAVQSIKHVEHAGHCHISTVQAPPTALTAGRSRAMPLQVQTDVVHDEPLPLGIESEVDPSDLVGGDGIPDFDALSVKVGRVGHTG